VYTVSTTSPNGTIPQLHIHHAGDVLTVTLDAPERGNEISVAMFEALAALLAREAAAPSAKVLVLRATGEVFCTGRERSATDLTGMRAEATRLIALKRALRATPLISIARVHGKAAGFGMGLAMLCDFAIAADTAPLQFPEMKMGLPPAAIMAYLGEYALPRHAFPLVLFGDPFTAQHARDIGLISEVVPAAELDAAVDALVTRICAVDAASARACKELFLTMQQGSFDANCRLAADALPIASATLIRRPAH
jgi:enoyl-CoA hydratase/carnithine racemase